MADGITFQTTVATPPNATIVATDDAGASGHVQLVKLAISTDGSATALTANNTDGLLVNLGSNNDVVISDGGNTITVDGAVVVTNAGTFAVQVDGAALTALQLIDDTVFAEDVAAQAAGKGIAVLAIRRDADTSLVDTDNDYANLQVNATGALKVEIFDGGDSHTIDGSVSVSAISAGDNNIGNVDVVSVIPGTGATNLGKAEDAAHTSGDVGVMALGVYQSAQADFGADGDYVPFSIDDAGGLRVSVVAGSAAGTQYTEDAAAAADPVGTALIMVRDDALSGQTTTDGDNVAARGTDKGELYVKHADAIPVTDNSGSLTVDNGGTFAVQVTGDALTALQLIDDVVFAEDAAHVSGDKGIMALSVRKDTAAAVGQTDGDYQPLITNGDGRLHTLDANSASIKTAVETIDNALFQEDSGHLSGEWGVAVLAVRRDADTSLVNTDADYANLQVDANGALKVEIFDGGGSHTVDNAGTFAVQVDGNALTALQLIDNPVFVDDNAFTPASSSVMMAGFEADEAAIDSVDEGDAGAARMTLDRKVIVNPQPHTAGGLSIFRSLDLDETEEEVKASAGQVYGWFITNRRTSAIYVKFYNDTVANVEVGTTAPVMTLAIPGNSTDYIAANALGAMGIAFSAAITVAATTGFADNDTGAPGANECIINIFYK